MEPDKKVASRIFLALVAIAGATACEKVALKNGDSGTIVHQTNCWQYPGGENASLAQAPQGQENHGLILEGALAKIEFDEDAPGYPSFGNYLRVIINGKEIIPSRGVIVNMAEEQGLQITPDSNPKPQACWIRSADFSPAPK